MRISDWSSDVCSSDLKAWRKSGLSASAYWAPSRSDAQRLQDLAAFERVAARDDVTLAPCWAHTRRKFYDVEQQTGSPIAAEALRRIALPYEVGKKAAGQSPRQRVAGRRALTRPHPRTLNALLYAQPAPLPTHNTH